MAVWRSAIGTLLVASVVACGSEAPSSTVSEDVAPPAAGPEGTVQAEREGVRLALRVDHVWVQGGNVVTARVDIMNLGIEPVTWQSGGCGLFNGFRLDGPQVPQPPPGREWPGVAGLAKWSATGSGVLITGFIDPRFLDQQQGMACTADLRLDDIGPGKSASVVAAWSARTSDGAPTPPGAYALTYDFPFLARVAKEQYRGDTRDARPITVKMDLSARGDVPQMLPSTLAFDAALANRHLAAILAPLAINELNGASVRLVGHTWRIDIRTQRGDVKAVVDARSGVVIMVEG